MTQREALGLSRNVLEHFDEYPCGTGKRQKKDAAKTGLSNEERARQYQPELGAGTAAVLRIGASPQAEIDLASVAPTAARRLVKSSVSSSVSMC
jgi:hypothetical protein